MSDFNSDANMKLDTVDAVNFNLSEIEFCEQATNMLDVDKMILPSKD